MSSYPRTLSERQDSLETALHEVKQSDDGFLDRGLAQRLHEAERAIEEVLHETEQERKVLERDWSHIESTANDIVNILTDIAETLDDAGVVDFDTTHGDPQKVLDDEPDELYSLRVYLSGALHDWTEVMHAASDAKEESGGRY